MIELPLETARLRIRALLPERNAARLHEPLGDPEAMRFIPRDATAPRDLDQKRSA